MSVRSDASTSSRTGSSLSSMSVRSDASIGNRPNFTGEGSSGASTGQVLCDACPNAAVKTCLTCRDSLCMSCIMPHYTNPDLERHKLQDFQDLQDLQDQSLCQQHHKQLEFYCKTDQSAICSHCLLKDHRGHDVVEQADTYTDQEVTGLLPGEMYHLTVATPSEDGRQSPCVDRSVHTDQLGAGILSLFKHKDHDGKEDFKDNSRLSKHSKENSGGNQNWGWFDRILGSRSSERSSEKRPDIGYPADFRGLLNQGATCYLNSVLQILYMTPKFKEAVSSVQSQDGSTVLGELKKLFGQLDDWKAESSISTWGISNSLMILNVCEQEDAVEYFLKILNAVGTDVSKVYRGTMVNTTTCLDTHHSGDNSYLKENFTTIPISMEDAKGLFSVSKGLKEFSEPIQLHEKDWKYCCECQRKTKTEIKYTINRFPTILSLHLKRFDLDDHMNYVKSNCPVEIPTSLNVQDRKYSLYGILNHLGSICSGHHTAWLKSAENGKWYNFDDSHVSGMDIPEHKPIRSESAYLLMYRGEKEDTP